MTVILLLLQKMRLDVLFLGQVEKAKNRIGTILKESKS
jgi:hypothetical protein